MSRLPEQAFFVDCQGSELPAIVHAVEAPRPIGVLIVVGGPQYRVGSHRQFVLLARDLAAAGIPVMRFDYRGMGDAEGAPRDFAHIDDDLRTAVDAFISRQPGIKQVMLWGLCDAASAALLYAAQDPRIGALMLLNPWLQQQQAQAQVVLKHYYWQRLRSTDFWRKLLRGSVNWLASVKDFSSQVRKAGKTADHTSSLSTRMALAWKAFAGRRLVILSGDDLVAQEFLTVVKNDVRWHGLLEQDNVQLAKLPEANHTFSRREWRNEVSRLCREFVTAQED